MVFSGEVAALMSTGSSGWQLLWRKAKNLQMDSTASAEFSYVGAPATDENPSSSPSMKFDVALLV
jgi:hypothetical protein